MRALLNYGVLRILQINHELCLQRKASPPMRQFKSRVSGVFKALEAVPIGDRLSSSADFFLVSLITLSVIAVVFLLLASCAVLTEEQQYAREDALILARERYEVRQQACNEAGGVMFINTGGQKLRKRVTRHDYKSAVCVRL
jgi:hypothetical protein